MKERNSINCAICGQPSTDTHHIFYGRNRQNSEKYKEICCVRLCRRCHRLLHDGKLKDKDLDLKRKAQQQFIEEYSFEKFMEVFKKNYGTD